MPLIPKHRYDYYMDIENADPIMYQNVMDEYRKISLRLRYNLEKEQKINNLKSKLDGFKETDKLDCDDNKQGSLDSLYCSLKKNFQDDNKPNTYASKVFTGGEYKDKQINNINKILDAVSDTLKQKIEHNKTFTEKAVEKLNKLIEDPYINNNNQSGGNGYFVPDDKYRKQSIDELNSRYFKIKNNQYFYDVDVTSFDILVFIITIYVIQQISMIFVNWAIDVEFVRTFDKALLLYIGIYLLLFMLIIGLVNIDYTITDTFNILPSVLYYFFMKSNGVSRIAIHLIFMLLISVIPFIIQTTKSELYLGKYILNNMKSKRDLYLVVNKFTLISWFICSVMAMIIR